MCKDAGHPALLVIPLHEFFRILRATASQPGHLFDQVNALAAKRQSSSVDTSIYLVPTPKWWRQAPGVLFRVTNCLVTFGVPQGHPAGSIVGSGAPRGSRVSSGDVEGTNPPAK